MLDLSIIIVSWNVREYLLKCIASVKEHIGAIAHEIIVVDNNSSDGSADAVGQRYNDIVLIRNSENEGFARANNLGYEKSSGEYILLLNPDTEIKKGSIDLTLDALKKEPRAGVAGCRIVGSDGKLQKSIHPYSTIGRNIVWSLFIDRLFFPEHQMKHYYKTMPFKVDSIAGAFMLIKREAIGNGPLLNPDYFMYAEEKDLSLRLCRAGWSTLFVPTVEILHYGGISASLIKNEMFLQLQKSQVLFYRNFYSKRYALALCLSWWLILCSQTIVSLPLALVKGPGRFLLFAKAAIAFPGYMITELKKVPGESLESPMKR